MVQVRLFNARLARRRHDAIGAGDRRAVIGLQVKGLTADLVRGVVLTAVGLLALLPLQRAALASWGASDAIARSVVVAVAVAVALGAAYKLFHAVPGFLWQFGLGVAAGAAVVWSR
jgi:PTS system mannose-specific IIC component